MRTGIFQFGEHIDGYPVRVLNERAVRAAAGLLLVGAFISFANAMLVGNFQPTRLFVLMFILDMAIRVFVNPLYAPSMIVGGWVVRHQTPDWMGAPQKRFAWGLGLALGLVMAWTMVVHQVIGPINMLVCGTCLVLMFFETSFGICLGCKLYNLFNKDRAQLCPGGVCEVPATAPKHPMAWGKGVVLVAFVGYAVAAGQWVRSTAPAELSSLDNTATRADMGARGAGSGDAVTGAEPTHHADTERCKVPAFAKAIGHEDMWKKHNNCS